MKRRSALEVYAYIMVGVSAVLCASGIIVVCVVLVGIAEPEMLLTEEQVLRYGHNDNYRKWLGEMGESLTEDQITVHRTEAKEVALEAALHAARVRLTEVIPFAAVFGILAYIHWRIIRRLCRHQRENSPQQASAVS